MEKRMMILTCIFSALTLFFSVMCTTITIQNEKNRTLLKEHITQIRNRISQFSDPRHNPYAKNTSIYSQKVSTPSIIDIEI